MKVTIFHNPRCSKSRETLKLLQAQGIEPEIMEYLKTPLSFAQLEDILEKLNFQPRELMRTKEPEYTELGLDDESLSHEDLINSMIHHPKLIERPIVLANNQAAIGRPPEAVLAILNL
jgi:arsenate reductase